MMVSGELKQYLDARSFNMALELHNKEDPEECKHISRFRVYCIGQKVHTATKTVNAILSSPWMLENLFRVLDSGWKTNWKCDFPYNVSTDLREFTFALTGLGGEFLPICCAFLPGGG